MNKIQQKLRSRVGASMILAMVFMLFCSFIGGTVLASATANAQRVAQMAEQQDFLLERSAALLATDQLQLDSGKYLRLTVVDQDRTLQAIIMNPNGTYTPAAVAPIKDRVITFTVSTNTSLTQMHRLMLECTVWRYLREHVADESLTATVILSGFGTVSDGGVARELRISDFLYPYAGTTDGNTKVTVNKSAPLDIGGSMDVKSVSTGVQIPDYIANFSCGRDTDLYDFFIDFGEHSQVKMRMNAFSGTNTPTALPATPVRDTTTFPGYNDVEIRSISTTTTISWENPMVEKGGAD
jgi:type II secretory pathway pseudopilin PulG